MKKWYPPGAIQSIQEFANLLKTVTTGTKLKLWSTGTYNEKENYPLKTLYLTSETKIQGGVNSESTAAPVHWESSSDAGWVDLFRRIIIDTDTPMYLFTNYWLAYGHKLQEDTKRNKQDNA